MNPLERAPGAQRFPNRMDPRYRMHDAVYRSSPRGARRKKQN
jgi:hypothetical protein